MARTPGMEPPGPGGGAAERLRQFEQERGLDSDDALDQDAEDDVPVKRSPAHKEHEQSRRGDKDDGPPA